MGLDIDRINDVLEGKFSHRGCGKTTATIAMALAQVDFGAEVILLVCVGTHHIEYLKQQIPEIAIAMGFRKIHREGNDIRINKTLFRFVTGCERDKLVGYNKNHIYEMY